MATAPARDPGHLAWQLTPISQNPFLRIMDIRIVIPAKAGIHFDLGARNMDSRLRGNDELTKSPPPDKARSSRPSHTPTAPNRSSDTSQHHQLGNRSPRSRRMHHPVPGKAGDGIEIRHPAPAPDDGIAVQLVLLVEP
jgi:hypothetical protein